MESKVVNSGFASICAARKRLVALAGFSLLFWLLTTSWAQAVGFTNATPILTSATGGTTPYPSIINVSQLSGEITSVAVTLVNITHSNPDDLDILLVSPQGQTVLLMSDAGGSTDVTNVTISFSPSARSFLSDTNPLSGGVYLPTNYGTNDTFPNGPNPPYGNKLSAFDGDNPNGQWRLYVVDDNQLVNGGGITGGWRLFINTTNRPPAITTPLVDQTVPLGANVTFKVGVDGTPPFGYQWSHDGVVIVPFGQGSDTLRLLNVQAAQDGLYTVMVTNGVPLAAGIGSQARLTVLSPIAIEPLPTLLETQPGSVITLVAKATGTQPLHYQWLLNGMVISNATASTLRLTEISPYDAGKYSVIVWNDYETKRAGPTLVRVLFQTAASPQDLFAERPRINANSGVVMGDSTKADSELGEPVSPGGGKTMWLEVIPQDTGIMTVRTRGSTFDTLLNIFTGQDVRNLDLKTQDDDRDGFFTSSVQFNVVRGQPYEIQIDGFGRGGDGGPFTLSWNLEPTQATVPVIVRNTPSQVVKPGGDAVFRVLTETADVSYQWYFLGPPYDKPQPLEGQNAPTLIVRNVAPDNVGFYYVVVRNQFNRLVIGPSVVLQISNLPYFVHDKFEALYSMSLGGTFIPFGLGNSVNNTLPSEASSSSGDPDPCGSPFFGTLWLGLAATNTGTIQVETTGSQVPTRMAVYKLTGGIADFSAPALICDLSSATNGKPCVAKFDAQFGTNYTVVVEGVGNSGNITLDAKMGIAPALTNTLKYCLVAAGSNITLTMPAPTWCPIPSCQWRYNGANIPNATNGTLTVSNFSALAIGTYSVFISNFVSSTTRDVAYLDLAPPFELHSGWVTNGTPRFRIVASNASPFVIETTTSLGSSWTPIATNPDPCFVLYYTNNTPFADPRRFYRAVPWLGP